MTLLMELLNFSFSSKVLTSWKSFIDQSQTWNLDCIFVLFVQQLMTMVQNIYFLIFVFSMNKEKPGWRMMERIIIDYILCHHCEM